MLISTERGGLALDPAVEGLVTGASRESRHGITNELAIIQSEELAREVVKDLDPAVVFNWEPGETVASVFGEAPDPMKAAENKAVKQLQRSLVTDSQGDVITIGVNHSNPDSAHTILSALLDKYLDRHIKVHSSAASPEFFREKTKEIEAQIEKQKGVLRELKEEHNISSITEQKAAAFQRVNDLETQLSTLQASVNASQAKIDSLRELVGATSDASGVEPGVMENPRVTELKGKLLDLQLEETQLEGKYVNSRELRTVREQIEQVKETIAGLPATVPRAAAANGVEDPAVTLENEKIELKSLQAQKEELENQLAAAKDRLAELEENENNALMAQRELAHLNESYFEYKKGLETAEINAKLDRDKVSNVSIVQPPTRPLEPVGPQRLRNLAMFVFLGLMGGVGVAFVLEYLDTTVKSQRDLESKLGLSVLATVPEKEFKKCI